MLNVCAKLTTVSLYISKFAGICPRLGTWCESEHPTLTTGGVAELEQMSITGLEELHAACCSPDPEDIEDIPTSTTDIPTSTSDIDDSIPYE